jgi:hypothetical protein
VLWHNEENDMSVSRFTVYTSSDANGPGPIAGAAGTLLTVLDGCLVNGYSGKTAAGWTKPFANASNIGCYKQGAGAGLGLVINDNGQNVTSTFKEAWAIGWEIVAGVGSPVGTGTGQFPTPAQLNTTGHCVVRKSVAASSATNYWILFADASTFYLFILTGDTANTYQGFFFGDMFSLAGSADKYRCILMGNSTENSNSSNLGDTNLANTVTPGHYMARSWGGTGTSLQVTKVGDYQVAFSNSFSGLLQQPNGPDNSYYLCPARVAEVGGPLIRGRLRGIYQVCHPVGNFTDGQTFSGGGDFAGKTFSIVKSIPSGGGGAFLAIETSNTVETN